MADWNEKKLNNMLNELEDCTHETIGGLTAGNALKIQIENAAAEQTGSKKAKFKFNLPWETYGSIAAVAGLLLIAILSPFSGEDNSADTVNNENITLTQEISAKSDNNMFTSIRAGSSENESSSNSLIAYDLPDNSISIAASDNASFNDSSIWDNSITNPYAMVSINNSVYRMLKQKVSADLIENNFAQIEEFTNEADLCNANVFSNVVQKDERIYSVKNMMGTAVIAEVNNEYRVFQRVSYFNRSVLGNEKFSDIFNVKGNVAAISSAYGKITDINEVNAIIDSLFSNVRYINASPGNASDDVLIITLYNGINLQLYFNDNSVSSCGTWECSEFIEKIKKY